MRRYILFWCFLLISSKISAQIVIEADSLTYCSVPFKWAQNQGVFVFTNESDYEASELYEKTRGECLPFEVNFDNNSLVAFLHNASGCDDRIVMSRLGLTREGYMIEFCPVPNVCRDGASPAIAWFVLTKGVENFKIIVERKPCSVLDTR